MADIIVNVFNQNIGFTSWYENISHQWVRTSNTVNVIIVSEMIVANPGYYGALFYGDKNMHLLSDYYNILFKTNFLSSAKATQNRVDDYLINTVPRILKLKAFV